MRSLTETSFYTRRVVKYGLILIISSIFLWFTGRVGYSAFRYFFPKPAPPPEVTFGRLPALEFGEKKGLPPFVYNLELPQGELPTFPKTVNVYFMPTPQTSFLNLEEATKIAQALGFGGNEPAPLSQVIYRFTHRDVPSTLDINIINKTFSVSYNLQEDPSVLSFRPNSNEDALYRARSFLSSSLFTLDLEEGTQTFDHLKSGSSVLETATSLSDANFIRVNFFRRDYDSLPSVTPIKNRANVWFLVSGATSGPSQIIAGEYHYYPIAEDQRATYPIKTAKEAYDALVAGKGSVVSYNPSSTNITIRRVYLGYYDSSYPQQFYQPVVVFDGDGGFRAVVPAIITEFYGD